MIDELSSALAEKIIRLLIYIVPMLLGMVLHELSHGWVALKLGDPTAALAGRLTLNPLKHLDPLGSAVFVLSAVTGPFAFGWAKPVPVDFRYFKNKRQAAFLVSLAGPLANFILAVGFAVLLVIMDSLYEPAPVTDFSSGMIQVVMTICVAGVVCNLVLAFFNLLPVPPMDGSKVLAGLMPPDIAYKYLSIGRYGFLIIILLLATGVLGMILAPVVNLFISLLLPV